jgi:signal transduction histidine kinase
VRLRDEFLSIASHELYTPVTSLGLSLQGLLRASERKADLATSRRSIEIAWRQTERLSKLIGDLLDVTRIGAGRLRLEPTRWDLAELVDEVVVRMVQDFARAQSTVSIDARVPVVGTWDRSRIDQVVTNLLSNAAKFGASKPIEIAVRGLEDKAILSVHDHGIGMGPGDVEGIFRRFGRAASPMQFGGLGLGLYISRQIVEAHGGTIRVESQPRQGATFIVELPLTPPQGG